MMSIFVLSLTTYLFYFADKLWVWNHQLH